MPAKRVWCLSCFGLKLGMICLLGYVLSEIGVDFKSLPFWLEKTEIFKDQGPVVQKMDNAIHRINHYPVDSVVCFVDTYPLDSDLSGG